MKVLERRAAMASLAASWRARGHSVGFVPTMGALHEGHRSLIERAARENDRVVVSIFVNPAQFGPNEDLARYPRTFLADRALCARSAVDALYHPSVPEVYPEGFGTFVEVAGLSDILCGLSRPGHFTGVATVVLKLLETVRPQRAYFGEKDFQQLVIVRKMARDLDLGVEIVGCPTVRESDGLALSSRNRYLRRAERAAAPALYAALKAAAALALRPGATSSGVASLARRSILKNMPGASIDYVSLVDPETLENAKSLRGSPRLLAAIRLGATRLIDNLKVRVRTF